MRTLSCVITITEAQLLLGSPLGLFSSRAFSAQAEGIKLFLFPQKLFYGKLILATIIGMCGAVLCLITQSCPILWDPMDCSPPGSSVLGASPGKNTGVGCHALLQGIFPTEGSNLCLLHLLHCRQILYH